MLFAAVAAVLCLVALPEILRTSSRFDSRPRVGLAVWASMIVTGWLAVFVLFLRIGLGAQSGSLVGRGLDFAHQFADGHPLRGLGLSQVVGLSLAADIAILLIGSLAVTVWKIWSQRLDHRTVVDLVATADPRLNDVMLVDHPQPMAYYLPGRGGRIVLSTGARDLLTSSELGAVISHERGHHHGRHGAWLVPLQALSPFVSFLPIARWAPSEMRALLEMSADDYARGGVTAGGLGSALTKTRHFQLAPAGALGVSCDLVERRMRRLSAPLRPLLDTAVAVAVASGCSSVLALLIVGR